ncbi:hypothetical protein R50072_21390 [Simiduia litorea]
MEPLYWHEWYTGWGWFLWFAVWVLMISSFGHWGYSYRTYRKIDRQGYRSALEILNERYVRGEIEREVYEKMKIEITSVTL